MPCGRDRFTKCESKPTSGDSIANVKLCARRSSPALTYFPFEIGPQFTKGGASYVPPISSNQWQRNERRPFIYI